MSPNVEIGRLLRAYEALTNWRACALILSAAVFGILIAVAGWRTETTWVTVIATLIGLLVWIAGTSGAGVLLMDQAREIEPRGVLDATVFGLICFFKQLGVFLGFALLLFGIVIVAALIFFVSKIPGLGPPFFAIAFPLIAAVFGMAILGILFVGIPMALPALWEGRSLSEAFAIVFAVARRRLGLAVTCSVFVGLVSVAIGVLTWAIFISGIVAASLVAAPVLAIRLSDIQQISPDSVLSSFSGGFGHVAAFGIDVVFMVVITLVLIAQVTVMGVNLVYLLVSEGLDTDAERGAIDGISRVRQKAEEMARRAQEAGNRAREAADQARQRAARPSPHTHEASGTTGITQHCPRCRADIGAGDGFCGACGFKLN